MPWNLTVKDLHKAWKSIADFLLEELAPKNLLPYFEMGGFLSIEESKVMCQLARTEVAKMLLQRIEAHLPAGFLCLLHALHETKQKVIVKQLRLRIKETLKPQAVKCKGPDDLCTFLGQLGRELMNAHKERLLANCKLAKLKFHGSTPPDGNCFFHAVADQLSLTGHLIQSAPDLRQELVNFLRNHETIQGPDGVVDLKNSVEKDWTTYCNDMMRDSEWVDATAVFAMAHMLKKDIMVVTSSPEENDHFIQWIVGVPNYKESPLLLGHVYESHYESLETDDDQKTSIPETDGLRLQKRKELSEIKPTEQGKEQSAVKPEEEGIVMKVEVLKDGKQLHRTEYIVGNDFCGGHIVFDYDMQSECLKFKHGSVTVYLRPLSKHAKETLSFFCQHGGMKNFVLDLLKKKNIFSSLPEGEICIKIQVCYGKDLTFEGHVDDSCIEVVQEDSTMHAQEDMLWSCHLTVAVRKNEDDPVIPAEVLKMDTSTLQMYKEALQNGRQKVHNIRVMVVGPYGVGKTTLINRLLGKRVDISERMSTEGIDVHTDCCKVSLKTGEWTTQEKNAEQYSRLQHVVKFLNEHVQKQEASAEREVKNKMDQSTSAKQDIDREVKPISSQPVDSSLIKVETSHDVEHSGSETSNVAIPVSEAESGKSEKNDAVMEILQLVNENFHKLEKSIEEYATLAMWDFAGMYAFYTTHQTFMTSHAIYLLVIDLSQHFTDIIEDEYFLDVEGIKLLKVHDSIEIWLNSIHSCAPSPDAGIPPVILVGTHVDKIPKSNHHEIYERYFREIRTYLKDKPTRFHLIDEDFAIDNTIVDSKLEDLKRKIVEVASQQPYWGEEIPARWLILEQELMRLRAAGVKVVTLRLVEELNRSGSVGIENREELDVFLRFQHDIGTILYFSMEVLKDKIVLDPQWMIDAIKSLITAKMFVLRKTPSVSHKWLEFTQSGKLSPELIDAVWTREQYPDFHDNKEHILLLLEHLNIIAKLRVHSEDEMEIKEDNFLVPCMLRQKTPEEVICPRPDVHMESSSVLCYVFVGKLLPAPIFHRLLAACIAHWPIATKKKEEMQETMIFCGCCVLQLDHYHRLTLYFREYVIFLRVTRMGIKDKTPSSKLCIEVREFITTRLHKIIGYLGQNLKFEHFIQCPEYSGVNIKSLIPVSLLKENVEVRCDFHAYIIESYQLLKYWFEDQEQFGEIDAWTSRRTKGSLPSTSTASVMTEIPIEAKRKHNMLCVTLDGLITKDSLRNIKQIARTYLGSKHLEKVKRMHDFLSALEDKGIIGVGKYDILIQIMKDANVRIGMDEIHKGAKDIKDIMESSIPSKEQSEKPSLNARN